MSDNINWNETAIYEFMRFEREPERRRKHTIRRTGGTSLRGFTPHRSDTPVNTRT